MSCDYHSARSLKNKYNSEFFAQAYPAPDEVLGVSCSDDKTVFKLWAPLALSVHLCLYADGDSSPLLRQIPMTKSADGIWSYCEEKNLHGVYYLYQINHGDWLTQSGDPYARACGYNSQRCMVVDLSQTDPEGWQDDHAPARQRENIIYELHIKEFSWQKSAGFPADYRGKYLAFTCPDTTINSDGVHPTGLHYLSDLGVTHVQLMPSFDYGSVDDDQPEQFNWGYDPVYYNIPEGSYSLDPHHGEVRIKEFKQMIQSLHRSGLRVIMDVVYNHTYSTDSVFNRTAPGYYYRSDDNCQLSNGSCCGNDFASEMPMAGKFILDSVLYWAQEYHIDGFRFDLMGLLDVALMNRIRSALDQRFGLGEKLLFGEPWAAGQTVMRPGSQPASKYNVHMLDAGIGIFSDDIRDSIRGHVFDSDVRGFVTGRDHLEGDILNSTKAWCFPGSPVKAPSQIISYVSAHDNHTLWDKLGHTFQTYKDRLRANKLAAAIYMTCQGNLFMLSGEEFGRTKDNHDNTYNESIELNRLDWKRAYEFSDLREYYRGLIALRKLCPGLYDKGPGAQHRIQTDTLSSGFVGFYVDNDKAKWEELCILYNRNLNPVSTYLRDGRWQVLVDSEDSFLWQEEEHVVSHCVEVPPLSAMILGR